MSAQLAVFVHHPAHDLRRGVDVGRRDIALGTHDPRDGVDVGAREAFELALGELFRVADDAALAAAERKIHHRRLPRHPGGERAHGIDRLVGVKANAALRRTARVVVLHAESLEQLHVAVVHSHRERHVELADRLAQHGAKPRIELEDVGSGIELMLGDGEGIERRGRRDDFGHGPSGVDCEMQITDCGSRITDYGLLIVDCYAYIPRIRVTVATRLMATMYAAVRMSTLYLSDVCSTALNASHIFASSRSFTSFSVQK